MAGGIRWNRDLGELKTEIALRTSAMEAQTLVAVSESVHAGEEAMRGYIETATTATGEARAGIGGSAGRIETGTMINSTNSSASANGLGVSGKMGWPDPEDYFGFQEYGTSAIGPMHALLGGFIVAREKLIGRLLSIVRGR